ILDSLGGFWSAFQAKGMAVLNGLFPPEKRAVWLAKIKAFAFGNPKLAAFLLSNIALTGLPLTMFVIFTITVFVFALVAALLVGVLAALLFTVFMVGTALLVVLPTVFMTTMGATFLFLWGLGGYYIIKWANSEVLPAPKGEAIGDYMSSLTGGKLDGVMGEVRQQEDNRDGFNE
ncbi:hypothetical protein K402DRAFT_315979, partial [Aulographum hederae CBS 113979]